ncbi:MAG: hypothetical protein IPJ65_02310 [Archangiaceae bacterium]|nr:hypothetical protein [Archangiaceae bacterium]
MGTPKSKSFADLGREAFDRAHAEICLTAAAAQERFAAALDAIGPAGVSRWDPIAGELVLRGRTFRAEQLGSFDGKSWLWSWANSQLNIPEPKTSAARRLRGAGLAAFSEPVISTSDERVPYMMGDFAIVHAGAEAYFLANRAQVFVLEPGQLPPSPLSPLDQLRRAIDATAEDLTTALPNATRILGLELHREPRAFAVTDGKDTLRVQLTHGGTALHRVALCFHSKQRTLAEVKQHLEALQLQQTADNVLELERGGVAVKITRSERLKDVMREANLLQRGKEDARRRSSVLIVETAMDPTYTGVRYGSTSGAWAPAKGEGAVMPAEALQVSEKLNLWEESLVYDQVLRVPYPKATETPPAAT